MKQNLNAAICMLNSKYIHSSLAPWCLLAGVREYSGEGILATVAEGTINENPQDIINRILDIKPQVVSFSCFIWNIDTVKELIRLIKEELPDVVIVLGGPEVSYNAADILREEPLIDYVVSGEGEKPFALLLDAIHLGDNEPRNTGDKLPNRRAFSAVRSIRERRRPAEPVHGRIFQSFEGQDSLS